MNKGLKVLCISLRTPPEVRPQAILIGKMIPEWVRQGIDPVIVTYKKKEKYEAGVPVYEIEPFRINRYINKIPLIKSCSASKYYKEIVAIVGKIIKEHNIELVFSFSNPQESNLIGAKLKKKLNLKFVSHFSDPWFDNPLEKYSYFKSRDIYRKEKFIIKNSDRVIFTNETARDLIMRKYPAEWKCKTEVIPHCYQPEDYNQNNEERTEKSKFIFSYIGAFYKKRNPEIIFNAFSEILSRKPYLADKVRLDLIGVANNYTDFKEPEVREMVEKHGLDKIVKIIPPVLFRKSLDYMLASDCLLILDADLNKSPFLPSKLIDYAGSGNIIIGITPDDSPSSSFLSELGCPHFNYDEPDKIEECFERIAEGRDRVDINHRFLENFHVRNTTARLLKIFAEEIN